MYRNIYNHIIDSLDDRVADIVTYIATHNRFYVTLTNRSLEAQNNILKVLPDKHHYLVTDYEILLGERDSLKNLILYKQGIIDGIKIKNLVSIKSGQRCPIKKGEI